jgi:hypothetical protein
MSTEEDKIKHSKRLHKEEAAIKRQAKIAKAYGIPVKETHTFAKHHAIDFGREVGLKFSNPRKSDGEESIQEKRSKQVDIFQELKEV